MTNVALQAEIDSHLAAIDGEVTTQSRVVDALLDLRMANGVDESIILAIDDALANIPGRTAVPNEWWLTRLQTLRMMLDETNIEAASPIINV